MTKSYRHVICVHRLSQEMIKGSPNGLFVGLGWGLGFSHNAIWWNLAIFFYAWLKKSRPKDGWTGLQLSPCLCVVGKSIVQQLKTLLHVAFWNIMKIPTLIL